MIRDPDGAAPSRRDSETLLAPNGDLPGWRPAAWRPPEAVIELEAWLTGASARAAPSKAA
jgi:hypothetical protein